MIMKCLVKEPLGSVRHKSFIKHPGNKHSYEQAFSGKLCMPVLLSGVTLQPSSQLSLWQWIVFDLRVVDIYKEC